MSDINKAIKFLKEQYKLGKDLEVRNPLAWALYHTWREFDEE